MSLLKYLPVSLVQERNLNCTPLEILYHYLLNTKYGVDCDPKYTIENAYLAYRDKWAYAASLNCGGSCSLEDLLRRANYGCTLIPICADVTLDCNITVGVDTHSVPCRTININIT